MINMDVFDTKSDDVSAATPRSFKDAPFQIKLRVCCLFIQPFANLRQGRHGEKVMPFPLSLWGFGGLRDS